MRVLMWFVIGFGAACGFCALGVSTAWILSLMAVFAVLFVVALYFRKHLKMLNIAAVTCMGCCLGLSWFLAFQTFYLNAAIKMNDQTQTVTVHVSDYSYATAYGGGVDGYVMLEGKPYQVRIYINAYKEISPGDEITGEFRFRVATADGESISTYHQGKGIFLIAYQAGTIQIKECESPPWWYFPVELRADIKLILEHCFPEDTVAFAKALLLGDNTGLDYETDTAFKISGIRHIIAVSGLHVSILYGLLSVITLRRRYLTAVVSIPMLLLFAAVTGFTPSVNRACIMVGLMVIAMAFNREYDPSTALALACLVMLFGNPLVITSVSFQLSVASVAGILMFYARINGWFQKFAGKGKSIRSKLYRGFSSSVSVTLSATLFTTPLSAYYFGAVSLVGMLTNLLTLWVISFIFYGIIAVCLLHLVWASAAMFLGNVIAWPIRYVLHVSKMLSGIPLAAVYTKSPYIIAWLVFVYCLLAVFLLSKKKKPWVLGCCAVIGLCLALVASWAEPLLDECRVMVLDVGQGQSILLQSEGRTYLVDCGGDYESDAADTVAETLLSQGVDRLDGIILTHYDRDHSGGLLNLLTRVQTDLLLMPATQERGINLSLEEDVDGTVVYVDENLEINCGTTVITIFAPTFSKESNENSLCILFQTETCDILITGDRSEFGEKALLRQEELPQVELLIAGHHGSKYSTSQALLDAVQPEIVIISVGEGNSYGHPAPEVLERLSAMGCQVYRTDINGTVIFRR